MCACRVHAWSVLSCNFSPQHLRGELQLHIDHDNSIYSQPVAAACPRNSTSRIQTIIATMAQSATPQVRSLYRRLLRELPSTPQTTRTRHQKLSAPSPLQKAIRSSIATPKTGSSTQQQIQQAEQFVQYVQAQRTYASLLERYNPGMGMTEEERVRLSARRVGMNLPVEFSQDGEKA